MFSTLQSNLILSLFCLKALRIKFKTSNMTEESPVFCLVASLPCERCPGHTETLAVPRIWCIYSCLLVSAHSLPSAQTVSSPPPPLYPPLELHSPLGFSPLGINVAMTPSKNPFLTSPQPLLKSSWFVPVWYHRSVTHMWDLPYRTIISSLLFCLSHKIFL